MSEYSSPESNQILTKTNSIVGIKITEIPQYKGALSENIKFNMAKIDKSQLPNILTKDVDNSFQTMKTISNNNMLFKSKYSF
jgi:hypothetical protein